MKKRAFITVLSMSLIFTLTFLFNFSKAEDIPPQCLQFGPPYYAEGEKESDLPCICTRNGQDYPMGDTEICTYSPGNPFCSSYACTAHACCHTNNPN